MNDIVRMSINARKDALYNGYEIDDDLLKNKIEDLFSRINEFGEECNENDFETKFASSTLNQEYINLFTEIATKCKAKVYESNNEVIEDKSIGEEIADDLAFEAKETIQPIKGRIVREAIDQARDIPGVGEAIDIKNKLGFFGRFKK